MFDRIVLARTSREYVPYEKTVVEKRAPTDDSVRLYEEIKDKAYESILESIRINDNSLNTAVIVYEEPALFGKTCMYRLTLNGKELSGKIDMIDFMQYRHEDILRKIIQHLAEKIAIDLGSMLIKK